MYINMRAHRLEKRLSMNTNLRFSEVSSLPEKNLFFLKKKVGENDDWALPKIERMARFRSWNDA